MSGPSRKGLAMVMHFVQITRIVVKRHVPLEGVDQESVAMTLTVIIRSRIFDQATFGHWGTFQGASTFEKLSFNPASSSIFDGFHKLRYV